MKPLGFDCSIMAPDFLPRVCVGALKEKRGDCMQDGGLSEAGGESSGRPRGETKSIEDEPKRPQNPFFLERRDSDGRRTSEENYECVGGQKVAVVALGHWGGRV